jgi:ParB family chromosome partitioning protein
LDRNKHQPRNIFDEEKLNELSLSIKENGIIQPIAVRLNKYEPGRYEIVAGERRWLAAQKAGLHEVSVVILDVDDQKSLEIAIVENVQRQDLNPIEEAKGYQKLIKEFGYDHEKISKFMSKSRSHISNTLRLLTLPQDIIVLIEEGLLAAGQARPLIGLANASAIAEDIVKKKINVRDIEALAKLKKDIKKTSKKEDPNITFIQNEIENKIGLNIRIVNKKNNSGKIIIRYKSLEQFELVSKLLRS